MSATQPRHGDKSRPAFPHRQDSIHHPPPLETLSSLGTDRDHDPPPPCLCLIQRKTMTRQKMCKRKEKKKPEASILLLFGISSDNSLRKGQTGVV